MKILHFADLHARHEAIEDVRRSMADILTVADEERPDLIIDAGDIFDSNDVRLDSAVVKEVARWMASLSAIAPVARVIGTRSHDGRASEIFDLLGNVHTAVDGPAQYYLTEGGNLFGRESLEAVSSGLPDGTPGVRAVVSLIPSPTKENWARFSTGDIQQTDQEIGQGMAALFAGLGAAAEPWTRCGTPHILVTHLNVSGAFVSDTQVLIGRDIEVSREQLESSGAGLICLGHIHKAQQIGDRIFYPGSPQVNNWGELDPKGFYIHEFEDGEWSHSFVRTPCRPRLRVAHDFTRHPAERPAAVLFEKVAAQAEGASADDLLIRLDLTIYQDEEARFDRGEIASAFTPAEVEINFARVARANVRSREMLEIERLADKVKKRAEIIGEEIPEGVIECADALEDHPAEELVADVRDFFDGREREAA